jgi:hypothetical protein
MRPAVLGSGCHYPVLVLFAVLSLLPYALCPVFGV